MSQRRVKPPFLVAVLLVSLTGLFGVDPSYGQEAGYLEETHTIESLYETRARNALNNLLRPNDYTVSVSARLKDDPSAINEYQNDLDLRFLPGLPVPTDPEMMPANNKLHQLKASMSVHLILSDNVSPEKDTLLKDILGSKLHLSEEAGDKITITRSSIVTNQPTQTPDLLPDLSWKMWVLILLVTLGLLAAVVLFLNRRRTDAVGANDKKEPLEDEELTDPDLTEEKDEVVPAGALAGESWEPAGVEAQTMQTKEEIVSVVSEYPQLSSRMVEDLLEQGRGQIVTITMQVLGWTVSRKLFPFLSPQSWGKIGNVLRDIGDSTDRDQALKALKEFHRELIATTIKKSSQGDDTNPFLFLFQMERSEMKRLLKDESPTQLAVVCLSATGEQTKEILSVLPEANQNSVILEISRLQSLPGSTVRSAARVLKSKFEVLRQTPELEVEGPYQAAQLLKGLSPEREMDLFNELLASNPHEAEKIRRSSVQFVDLARYPETLVGPALEGFEVETLTAALHGVEANSRARLLSLMPQKKARMVEYDLERTEFQVSKNRVAEARRSVVLEVQKNLESQGLTIKDLWVQIDERARGLEGEPSEPQAA